MLDFVVFHGSLLGNDFSKQQTELRNIPLAVSEIIQELALSIVGIDLECQIERSARGNDPQILIEDNERFSNRVDDSVRKYPGILDLGKLLSDMFLNMLDTLVGAGAYATPSPRRAEDRSTVYPPCAVSDAI